MHHLLPGWAREWAVPVAPAPLREGPATPPSESLAPDSSSSSSTASPATPSAELDVAQPVMRAAADRLQPPPAVVDCGDGVSRAAVDATHGLWSLVSRLPDSRPGPPMLARGSVAFTPIRPHSLTPLLREVGLTIVWRGELPAPDASSPTARLSPEHGLLLALLTTAHADLVPIGGGRLSALLAERSGVLVPRVPVEASFRALGGQVTVRVVADAGKDAPSPEALLRPSASQPPWLQSPLRLRSGSGGLDESDATRLAARLEAFLPSIASGTPGGSTAPQLEVTLTEIVHVLQVVADVTFLRPDRPRPSGRSTPTHGGAQQPSRRFAGVTEPWCQRNTLRDACLSLARRRGPPRAPAGV